MEFDENIHSIRLRDCYIACKFTQKVIIYDFVKRSIESQHELQTYIVDMQWLQESLIVIDINTEAYKITGELVKLELKSNVISPSLNGCMLSCFNSPLGLLKFRESDSEFNYTPINVPEDYEGSQAAISGCALISNDTCAVGFILDERDSLICIYKIHQTAALTILGGGRNVSMLHYAFNELYLLEDGDSSSLLSDSISRLSEDLKLAEENSADLKYLGLPAISFDWIAEWDVLFAYSSDATQVVVLSRNTKLTRSNGWHVVMMQEGYCLESTDGDNCPRGLSICNTFKDDLYRKNACADTPLLVNPPVFFLPQKGGTISIHYADIFTIDVDLNTTQILPFLKYTDKSHVVKARETSFVSSEKPFSTLTDIGDQFAAVVSLSSEKNEAKSDQGCREGTNFTKIENLYSSVIEKYTSSIGDELECNERVKLFEMFANAMHMFETNLTKFEEVEFGNLGEVKEPAEDWGKEIHKLRGSQDELIERLKLIDCTLKPTDFAKTVPDGIKFLHDKVKGLKIVNSVKNPKIVDSEFDLVEAERILNHVSEALENLNSKLDRFEERIHDIEAKVIFEKFKTMEGTDFKEKEPIKKCSSEKTIKLLEEIAELMKQTKLNTLKTKTYTTTQKFNKYNDIALKNKQKYKTPDVIPGSLVNGSEAAVWKLDKGDHIVEPSKYVTPVDSTPVQKSVHTDVPRDITEVTPAPVQEESKYNSMQDDKAQEIQEDTANEDVKSINIPVSSVSIFGTSTQVDVTPTFGHASYKFGESSNVLGGYNLGLSTSNTSVFSSFATNKSFADVALSQVKTEGETFTGLSGFTSGNFKPTEDFANMQSLSNILSTNQTELSGDLWNRTRRANPLD